MEIVIAMKIKVATDSPKATPHSIGCCLKHSIEKTKSDADYEVVDWELVSVNPKK